MKVLLSISTLIDPLQDKGLRDELFQFGTLLYPNDFPAKPSVNQCIFLYLFSPDFPAAYCVTATWHLGSTFQPVYLNAVFFEFAIVKQPAEEYECPEPTLSFRWPSKIFERAVDIVAVAFGSRI